MKYALISVFDKRGVVEFAKTLHDLGYEIISTGGTAKVLEENKIPAVPIQKITGNPESFDGRMKTISFQIESGILFDRKNPKHVKEARALKIQPIDIVICNLYPFEKKNSVANIDVGGPTMVRAAAKNFANVAVVVDPADYPRITEALQKKKLDEKLRKELAAKAFAHLSVYDAQVARYLNREIFPYEQALPLRKAQELRYGENPHQKAALYLEPKAQTSFNKLEQKAGRGLSATNIGDINAGLEVVRLFMAPAAVIIKHNNPCGIALGKSASEALKRAIEADAESAFGGVIVLNRPLDQAVVKVIGSFKEDKHGNIDIVAAPSIANSVLTRLVKIRKSMGVYTFGPIPAKIKQRFYYKWVNGGLMVQTADDDIKRGFKDWKVVTKKKPTKAQLKQMKISWKFISRIKSNAILVMDKQIPMTRGIGSGQTSRVRSTKIALEQAGKHARGAVLASDSFFPFDDSVKLAAQAGITAIVQQGGSINDQASIDAADRAGIAMVFTGRRAFWH